VRYLLAAKELVEAERQESRLAGWLESAAAR